MTGVTHSCSKVGVKVGVKVGESQDTAAISEECTW